LKILVFVDWVTRIYLCIAQHQWHNIDIHMAKIIIPDNNGASISPQT